MYNIWDVMLTNFSSAPVLFFFLGVLAVISKSDLSIPSDVGRGVVIFLMASIGIRAGAEIAQMPGGVLAVLPFALTALLFGITIAAASYFLLVKLLHIDSANAGALAGSFGAVSSATLMVSISLLDSLGITYEKFVPALYPFMDSPAIIMAIFLGKWGIDRQNLARAASDPLAKDMKGNGRKKLGAIIVESLTNSGVYVLLGSLVIGLIVGPERLEREMKFFYWMFRGVLCIFLLEMGILAASRLRELKFVSPLIVPLAILISLAGGTLAVFVGTSLGLSPGGAVVFAALAAGASYVSVPAAMRVSLPEANPSLYLGTALGITFPFNMSIGLPVYLQLAQYLAR
ncbi:MAG: sodium-dependent bicarbonate transport family permease [Dethiobacter sp.]|nr:sodium-dependent bicarbonate transport family permease [Dethiobacter sp.]MBS3902366.1 sodium-dependent bicarbonate transport family permease [Dethiobacter sp.]